MLPSHTKRSLSLWLQDKSCLLQPKKHQSEMVWYFIGLYIINRALHSYLEMQNVSSCVQNIFFNNQREISNVSVINIFFYRPKVDVSTLRPPDTIIAQPRRLIHPYALISGHPEWWTLGSPNTFPQQQSQIPPPKNINSSEKRYPQRATVASHEASGNKVQYMHFSNRKSSREQF